MDFRTPSVNGKFSGKIAVVTGASSGIGRGIAIELSAQGASVVVTGRNKAQIEETVQTIMRSGGKAVGYAFDVGNKSEIDYFFAQTLQELGGIDILVNNAGINHVGYFLENSEKNLEQMMRINFMGAVYCIQNAARLMKIQGNGGNIIVVTSVNAFAPLPSQTFYSALKAGLEGLVKGLAYEFRNEGIRVNTVAPGATHSAMLDLLTTEEIAAVREMVPLKRIGKPEDIAKAVAYLASDDASYVTGTSILVDGGLMLRQG